MKETIILLYFLQTDYGRRLLRFLTRKKNKQIRLELMTERERVMWRTETENQRIVVLTDDEGLYAEAKKEVILLGKADDRQQKKILQYQRAEGIYEEPLHPYTQALLSAIPPTSPFEEKHTIALTGDIPSPIGDMKGCPLASRCPHCTERCRKEHPALVEARPGHKVACFLYE